MAMMRSMWPRWAAMIGLVALATACKESGRGSASGDISRNWTPPQQETFMGVRAADVKAAIVARLAGKPPAPVSDSEWKHVERLYETFNQSLLWLDDKGVEQPRVSALLKVLASADS